jgi:hypothetical protein
MMPRSVCAGFRFTAGRFSRVFDFGIIELVFRPTPLGAAYDTGLSTGVDVYYIYAILSIGYKYALWSILEVSGLLPEGLAESAMKMAFFARPVSSRALQRKML